MSRRARTWMSLPAAVLAVAMGASCGVPADDSPRRLAVDDVPYGLLQEAPPPAPSTSTSTPAIERVNVAVYFLLDERLQSAPRSVTEPANVSRALTALLDGPTDEEAVNGLRSAISPTTEVSSTRTTDQLVTIALSASFAEAPTPEQRLALGQLVFTVTGLEGVAGVLFTVGGAAVGVPLPDGTVTTAPVTRDAFPGIAPVAEPPPPPIA